MAKVEGRRPWLYVEYDAAGSQVFSQHFATEDAAKACGERRLGLFGWFRSPGRRHRLQSDPPGSGCRCCARGEKHLASGEVSWAWA